MKILNPAVEIDLAAEKPLALNLGCGYDQRPGLYGVDLLPLSGVAIQADLNEPLALLPDSSVGHIFTYHCLEHVQNLMALMRELHRVLRPDGECEIWVPHFSNPYHYSDPTHVRTFGLYSMCYFVDQTDQPQVRRVPCFYSDVRFRITTIRINLLERRWVDRLMFPFLTTLINRSFSWQDRYERRLCRLFPASEIHYRLRPVK